MTMRSLCVTFALLSVPVWAQSTTTVISGPAGTVTVISGSAAATTVPATNISALGYAISEDAVVMEAPMEEPPAVTEGAAPEGADQAAEKKPRTKRAEKLRGLNFDRRASAILGAWSKPAPALKDAEVKDEAPPKDEKEAKKRAEAKAKKAEEALVAWEMETLQYRVTIGDWAAVRAYIAELKAADEDDAQVAYDKVLSSLVQGPRRPDDVSPQGQQYIEKNQFAPTDIVRLAGCTPSELKKEQLTTLGALLKLAIEQGHRPETFTAEWKQRAGAEGFPFTTRSLAKLYVAAGEAGQMDGLLPSVDEAVTSNDREALNLIARMCLANMVKDKDNAARWQVQAWQATLAVLASGDVEEVEKNEALQRAVELAPKMTSDLGERWLADSFTLQPERGREILASIGSATAKALQSATNDADKRAKLLELQQTAGQALLTHAPQLAEEWRKEMSLLASNWLREAQASLQHDKSKTYGPQVQRDSYGNIYYWDPEQMNQQWGVAGVRAARVIEARPNTAWLALVDATLRPRLEAATAQLYLKVGEDLDAFPFIEALAPTQPAQAKDLADEFLRVWARNNNPNADRSRNQMFVYSFGFDERANGIPLTRSKQERNLKSLGELVARLRAAGLAVSGPLLAEAFKAAHGGAEVYRIEAVEQIFGAMDALDPETFATLLDSMRTNLATVWRDAAVQEKAKTKRTKKDIEAEVVAGYEQARLTLGRALTAQPEAWRLWAVQAALMHDENEWNASLKKSAKYAEQRMAAFTTFAKAATLYAASLPENDPSKETGSVYDTWFYAALGASDLRAVNHEKQLASAEIGKIKAAIEALGEPRAKRHIEYFANSLASRVGTVNPAVKLRYVREGLAITGESKLVRDLLQLNAYYGDLVTEIQLKTSIDGSSRVGHGGAFGLRVDLRHTRDIERESGGFGKYLQNQNNSMYAFNYGRPTENYRDKFDEAARTALSEHFEVVSLVFNDAKVQSTPDEELGWRITPYAYILLKPRGAQVDRVPSLKLDLDFLDISGYVVLPIESSMLPIDAVPERGDARPFKANTLTQILDEKQWKDGKLSLEIKAVGTGLPGDWSELVSFSHPGLKLVKSEDSGAQVTRFLEDGSGVECERRVVYQLESEGGAEAATTFAFATPKIEVADPQLYRYDDADLVATQASIELRRGVAERGRAWMMWLAVLALGAGGVAWMWTRRTQRNEAAPARFPLPQEATAFSVLALLRDIERHGGLSGAELSTLQREIAELERGFFAGDAVPAVDLRAVAQRWAAKAA